jgi:hypothetical protein
LIEEPTYIPFTSVNSLIFLNPTLKAKGKTTDNEDCLKIDIFKLYILYVVSVIVIQYAPFKLQVIISHEFLLYITNDQERIAEKLRN